MQQTKWDCTVHIFFRDTVVSIGTTPDWFLCREGTSTLGFSSRFLLNQIKFEKALYYILVGRNKLKLLANEEGSTMNIGYNFVHQKVIFSAMQILDWGSTSWIDIYVMRREQLYGERSIW